MLGLNVLVVRDVTLCCWARSSRRLESSFGTSLSATQGHIPVSHLAGIKLLDFVCQKMNSAILEGEERKQIKSHNIT
jgi:hypothetical protein